MSYLLSSDHVRHLESLAAATETPWEQVLSDALSEYRGLVGVDPPEEPSPALDVIPEPPAE
ncbi:MAG: hypothetical protein AAF266_00360 [Planctomycetota bacterium]